MPRFQSEFNRKQDWCDFGYKSDNDIINTPLGGKKTIIGFIRQRGKITSRKQWQRLWLDAQPPKKSKGLPYLWQGKQCDHGLLGAQDVQQTQRIPWHVSYIFFSWETGFVYITLFMFDVYCWKLNITVVLNGSLSLVSNSNVCILAKKLCVTNP